MPGTFRAQRGSSGYTLDWNGDLILETAVEAARLGINDILHEGARIAREEHPWETRTGQTEAAVFVKEAELEWTASDPNAIPHVWGEWGVEDRPRLVHEEDADGNLIATEIEEEVTTKDVALFLEFGTVKMAARPWLYPAWDQTKVQLPAAIRRRYRELTGTFRSWNPRDAAGRFKKWS